MRKLQQVAIVAAAVGGLATFGAGSAAASPYPGGGQDTQPKGYTQGQQQAAPQQQTAPQQQIPQYQTLPQRQTQPNYQATPQQQPAPQQAAPQQQPAPQQAAPQQQPPASPLIQGGGQEQAPHQTYAPMPEAQPQAQPASAQSYAQPGPTYNVYQPAQECSPQTLFEANVPVGVLSPAETNGFRCQQINPAFNPR